MPFTTFRGEQSVPELVHRLFEIEGRDAEEITRRAEAAMVEANPELRDLRSLAPGTLLVVPSIPGVRPRRDVEATGLGDDLSHELRRLLGAAREALEAAAEAHVRETAANLDVLRTRELEEALRELPALEETMPEITAAMKKSAEGAREGRVFLRKQFDEMEEELTSFLKHVIAA